MRISINRPDDYHCHLRSGPMLRAVLPYTASQFRRSVVMPNRPWIGTADEMLAYRAEILHAAHQAGCPGFEPLMTIAISDVSGTETTPGAIEAARSAGAVAAKLYPIARAGNVVVGATTGPESGLILGVADPLSPGMREVYRAMADVGMVLCVHAEMPAECPRLEREASYAITFVREIAESFDELNVVVEHVSDERTVAAIFDGRLGPRIGATITAHHLVDTVDDALESPHHLCNPVPKHHTDRRVLWWAVETGDRRFFFGSDSAPHRTSSKHCARPACGCFSAPGLLPRLAQMFEARGILDKLEPFVSHHGADFYGLPRNEGTVTLVREPSDVPAFVEVHRDLAEIGWIGPLKLPPERIVVWRGGETLPWSVEESSRAPQQEGRG